MIEEAFIFFKVNNFEDMIKELKHSLESNEQYAYYDHIYSNISYSDIIAGNTIRGYSKIVKQLIFAIYYRECLYTDKDLYLYQEFVDYSERLLLDENVINDNISPEMLKQFIFNILRTISNNSTVRNLDNNEFTDGLYNLTILKEFDISKLSGSKKILPYFIIGNRNLSYDKNDR